LSCYLFSCQSRGYQPPIPWLNGLQCASEWVVSFLCLVFFFRDQIKQRRNSWKGEGGEEKAANSILSTPSPKEEGKNLSTKDGAIEILFWLLMSFVLIDRAFVVSNAMHQSISFLCTNVQKTGSNSYVHNQVFFFFFF